MFQPIDLLFCQKLIEVISDFSENKTLSTQEEGWCYDLRHMILKKEWNGEKIGDSHQLANTVKIYGDQELKKDVYIFSIRKFHVTKRPVLKKQLEKVIAQELMGALLRDVQARDVFIRQSKDAKNYEKLLASNTSLTKTLGDVRKLLKTRNQKVVEQALELKKLDEENNTLQNQLSKALEEMNQMTREIITLKQTVEIIPDLKDELKKMREEMRLLKSGQETLSRSFYGKSMSKSYQSIELNDF